MEFNEEANSPRTHNSKESFVAVDSLRHAQSVIKSLRSLSSSQRYQRSAVDSEHIVQSLPQFNEMVIERGASDRIKMQKENEMDQAIIMCGIRAIDISEGTRGKEGDGADGLDINTFKSASTSTTLNNDNNSQQNNSSSKYDSHKQQQQSYVHDVDDFSDSDDDNDDNNVHGNSINNGTHNSRGIGRDRGTGRSRLQEKIDMAGQMQTASHFDINSDSGTDNNNESMDSLSDEDDEEERRELFRGFTTPSVAVSMPVSGSYANCSNSNKHADGNSGNTRYQKGGGGSSKSPNKVSSSSSSSSDHNGINGKRTAHNTATRDFNDYDVDDYSRYDNDDNVDDKDGYSHKVVANKINSSKTTNTINNYSGGSSSSSSVQTGNYSSDSTNHLRNSTISSILPSPPDFDTSSASSARSRLSHYSLLPSSSDPTKPSSMSFDPKRIIIRPGQRIVVRAGGGKKKKSYS